MNATGFGAGGIVQRPGRPVRGITLVDDRVVLAGAADDGTEYRPAITVLAPSGAPDATFGTGGTATLPVSGEAWAAIEAGGGKLLVAGERYTDIGTAMLAARLAGGPTAPPPPDPTTVYAWGSDGSGQLGSGRQLSTATPTPIAGLTNVVAVAGNTLNFVARRADGTVVEWRRSPFDETTTVRPVSGVTGVVDIGAGMNHVVALRNDGTVWQWGGSNCLPGSIDNVPRQVAGLTSVTDIAAGADHNVARRDDGSVWAWGCNNTGQLGDGTTTSRAAPAAVPDLVGARSVAAGGYHSVALLDDGTVRTWGYNHDGALGDGTRTMRARPVSVAGLTGVTGVYAGDSRTYAVLNDGTVRGWGQNYSGELGIAASGRVLAPVAIPALTNVASIALNYSSIAVRRDGTAIVWGADRYGNLGLGSTSATSRPPTPLVLDTPISAAGNGSSVSALVMADGTVRAMGDNSWGIVGLPGAQHRQRPGVVAGLPPARAIAAGSGHSLAVLADGSVRAWGVGYLGDGTAETRTSPTPVAGLTSAVGVAAGASHSLTLLADGSVRAWGSNVYGQLGDGSTTTRATPVAVAGLTDVVRVAAGDDYSLAVTRSGELWAWGANSAGQLGLGNTTGVNRPTRVPGLSAVVDVAARGGWSDAWVLARHADGSVSGWGDNARYQLGNGTNADLTAPAPIAGLAGVVDIAATDGGLAALGDGRVLRWGGTITTPEVVPGLTGIVDVEGNTSTSFARTAAGLVWAWGYLNGSGRFGNQPTPLPLSDLVNVGSIAAGGSHVLALAGDLRPSGESRFSSVTATSVATTDTEGDGATFADPVETTVASPVSGLVTIYEGSQSTATAAAGFTVVGQPITITTNPSPLGTPANPLTITFRIDASRLPWGVDPMTIGVLRNGVAVPACPGDPCLVSRALLGDGDLQLVVRTSAASDWLIGFASPIADAGGPYFATEGEPIELDGSASEHHERLPLSFAWTSSESLSDALSASPTFVASDDGVHDVQLTVTGPGGSSAGATASVVVVNAPPVVATPTLSPATAEPGRNVRASTTFVDAGIADTHEATWHWGDGTTSPATVTRAGTVATASGEHVYAAAGHFEVSLVVVDDDGAAGGATTYAPVTARRGSVAVVGQVRVGSARVTATLTSAHTRGQLSGSALVLAPGLTFAAATCDWLLVSGSSAQLAGRGRVVGRAGAHHYLVTMVDGRPDRLRIRITGPDGGVVLDTSPAAAPNDRGSSSPLVAGAVTVRP